MKMATNVATIVMTIAVLAFPAKPLIAADDDAEAIGQFKEALQGMDQKSFEMIKKFIDQTDFMNRVYSYHAIAADVRETFKGNFWEIVEAGFLEGLPPQGSKISPELIQFTFEDGKGHAFVRFSLPKHEYRYHVFELRHDRRGRLKIIDWFDSAYGWPFTANLSDDLLGIKPTKENTRRLLSIQAPTDLQLFQATEILKASRDREAARFFEIYDAFDEPLKRDPLIARRALIMAYLVEDSQRVLDALHIFADVFADDPNPELMLSSFYVTIEDYERSFVSLRRFYQNFAAKDGALPARLSALALATGNADDAEKFAVEATVNEPTLELGWWSLLRARASVENYAGSIEVLAHLEDSFEHRLDGAKLRRDPYRAFTQLARSQEFRDWRASRP